MTRFYEGYPNGWEWLFAIDEENVVLRQRSNYRKMIFNIPTGNRTPISQDDCKRMREEIRKARNPNYIADEIKYREEKIAELAAKLEKLRREIEELKEG